MEVVKVSAKSVPKSVAGAIAAVIRENGEVEVQAVGAGASNQAVKAIAISRSYMALSGVDLVCIPAFTTVSIDGEESRSLCPLSFVRRDFTRNRAIRSTAMSIMMNTVLMCL